MAPEYLLSSTTTLGKNASLQEFLDAEKLAE
jgi:hypothetical protein